MKIVVPKKQNVILLTLEVNLPDTFVRRTQHFRHQSQAVSSSRPAGAQAGKKGSIGLPNSAPLPICKLTPKKRGWNAAKLRALQIASATRKSMKHFRDDMFFGVLKLPKTSNRLKYVPFADNIIILQKASSFGRILR